jgi:thiol-disulfide isomerase/thioredoxin
MQRRTLAAALVAASVSIAGLAALGAGAAAPHQAGPARLVVFEFFDSTCPTCVEASRAVEALAEEYAQAGRRVVFVEYSSASTLGNRLDRWYEACPVWQSCYLPLELVDSGWRWACGPKDHLAVYRSLVDEALANPPRAELTATYKREGDDLDMRIRAVNRSGRSLGPANDATVTVIVYENVRVLNTGRYARAAVDAPIGSSLADGAAADYRLQLADVAVSQWDRAVVLALIDYQPDPNSEAHEALQSVIAVEEMPATATPTPTPGPSPTPTATPVWLDSPLMLPAVMRAARAP